MTNAQPDAAPSGLGRAFPWLAVGVVGLWMASLPFKGGLESEFDLEAFRRLPVSFQGRVKPVDTVARNGLFLLSARSEPKPDGGEAIRPVPWLLDVMAKPAEAAALEVFRIDHPDVIALLDQRQRTGKKLFSYDEIQPHLEAISTQARAASQVDSKERDPYQTKVLELWRKLDTYRQLGQMTGLHLVAPLASDADGWRSLPQVLRGGGRATPSDPSAAAWMSILRAWHDGDADAFDREVGLYRAALAEGVPSDVARANLEVRFNRADPFINTLSVYVLVFLLAVFSWLGWRGPLERTAFALLVLAFVVHTAGLGVRVYLMERPPVTNLYSSAVLVGWGCVLAGAILERLYRNGVGLVTAGVTGFASLLVARGLSEGDTMAVLQAVLDTNFWLATHVVVITIGYAATFLAGFLALVYVIRGVLTTSLDRQAARSIASMVYGVVCFGLLFSFVGTILGGIWADQSWGRFWGWDPKENGALLIVLWNALILHARWGGLIRERGLMTLSILGIVVTAWSWFGTNMLGVGLHSYGFMDQALFWLLLVDAGVVALAGLSLIPLEMWRSDVPGKVKGK